MYYCFVDTVRFYFQKREAPRIVQKEITELEPSQIDLFVDSVHNNNNVQPS